MYNPILAKSFSHYERKTFGCGAFVLFLIVVLSSCMVLKPHLYPQSLNGDVMNLQLSISAAEDMLVIKDTTLLKKLGTKKKDAKPICNVLEPLSDYCETKGDIRVQGSSSTIFVLSNDFNVSTYTMNNSWTIQPYPRKGNAGAMTNVKAWTVKLILEDNENIPKCSVYHAYPAVLFSLGGYSGNHFHDFSDLLVPIFSNSQHFNSEVHFLATDYKPWWIGKYRMFLNKLSKHKILDIDNEKEVHCFPSVTSGLKSHKEFGIDPSKFPDGLSMRDFRQFLRSSFLLKRETIKVNKHVGERPRLLIMSRKKSRILLNEDEVRKMAEDLGYESVIAEANLSTNLSRFAQIVNSCDVVMGVHGAGLTNMVFLPDNAVLIQLVPLGAMDGLARRDFGNPAGEMNIRYLHYKISVNESSLVEQYPLDHKVFKDPSSFHKQGWTTFRSIYLDQQNVKVDLNRFRFTLLEAKKLLATA